MNGGRRRMDEKGIIEITTDGDITIVSFGAETITGLSGLEQISEELRGFIAANQPKKIVVDFWGVKFFSSQMLGLLVDVWRKLSDYGGVVLISGINPQLSRVFKITSLDRIFKFYPDRADAVKSISDKEL
jgi:anti-sigma B factor antagonist